MWRGCSTKRSTIEPAITEIALALAARLQDLLLEETHVTDDAHALPAAAGRRLDEKRGTKRAGALDERRRVIVLDGRRRHREAALGHEGAGADLVAHQVDRLGGRADKGDAGRGNSPGEAGILRQEAVAGMDGTRTATPGGIDDLCPIEIGSDPCATLDPDDLVGRRQRRCTAIALMGNHDRLQAHATGGADDAQGDLAPVRDQQRVERKRRHLRPLFGRTISP